LAEVFEPQLGEGIDGSALITRLENYGPDTVPNGVEVVTAFCDVQGDRLEIQFVGWAFNEEAFVLDYVIINLDPGQGAAWRELDSMTLRTFRRVDGKTLPCAAFGIDAGGKAMAKKQGAERHCTVDRTLSARLRHLPI
jgi:phage terminase large subunit GpA-like protein